MKITKGNKNVISNATVIGVDFDEGVSKLTLSYKVYDRDLGVEVEDEITIPFFNSKDKEYPQLADRIVNAGVENGSIVTVMYTEKDGKIYGQNFCFGKGWFRLPSDTVKYNFIQGYVVRPNAGTDRFSITIPIETGKDQTDWLGISFWNNDKGNLADRASKVIREGDLIAVLCGDVKETEKNGRTYKNLNGYRFEIIKRKETTATVE